MSRSRAPAPPRPGRRISVLLGDRPLPIGELLHDRDRGKEHTAWRYSADWLEDPEAFTIDPMLQMVEGSQGHRAGRNLSEAFIPAIADAAPDGWALKVIHRSHARHRLAAIHDGQPEPPPPGLIDFLLAVDDHARIGALRFRDEAGVIQAPPGDRRNPPSILRQALDATARMERNRETDADLEYLRGRGTSLGGARPKCTIVEDGRLAIGKFPSVQDTVAITHGEVLALRLAKMAGITAADASLVMCDKDPVTIIYRFDRTLAGARIPYCSASTLVGEYINPTATWSYADIIDAIRQHSAQAAHDCREIWRRLVFNIIINNVDDHLHNHGFLHVGRGLWNLAPAFDLNPAPGRERALTLWLSSDLEPGSGLAGARVLATYAGIGPAEAERIIAEVGSAVATWRTVGADLGMTAAQLDAFDEAFQLP